MQQENLLDIQSESVNAVELVIGDKAVSLLSDSDFLISWDALYNSCPWKTVYQGKEFVSTWYKIYHQKYLPIIVKEVNEHKLVGLFTLARDKKGLIIGAGAGQAEYQVWLATESNGERFIKNALCKIRKQFPGANLQFKFIPSKTPIEWAETDSLWKKRCLLQVYHQPLMMVDETNIVKELGKKNRRIKVNKLKRLGDLKFERITSAQTFSSIFDELAAQFDFRKGALYNITPFHNDPLRKEFLLALFNQNFLHATVLKLNDEIIASNVGAISGRWLHLQGINTHSPFYSKYSPGMLHMLMLGKLLAEEGFEVFDLTPGGNTYKEAFATNHFLTYELLVAGGINFHIEKIRKKIFHGLINNKQRMLASLSKMGLQSKDLKTSLRTLLITIEKIKRIRQEKLTSSWLGELTTSITTSRKNKIYGITQYPLNHSFTISKNNLKDLLLHQAKGSKLTKWEFLVEAMERFEKGHQVYTLSKNTCLLMYAWQTENKNECQLGNSTRDFNLPEGSIFVYDFYCHPDNKGQLKEFIIAVANEISNIGNSDKYLITERRNISLCQALEEIGFAEISGINLPNPRQEYFLPDCENQKQVLK